MLDGRVYRDIQNKEGHACLVEVPFFWRLMHCFAMPSKMNDFITSNRYNSFLKSIILNKMYGSCFSLHILIVLFLAQKVSFLTQAYLGVLANCEGKRTNMLSLHA